MQAVWNTCCRSVLVELSLGWIGFATFQGPAHALVMKSRWLKLLGAVLLRNCAGNKEHCACSGWSSAGNQSAGWKLLEATNFLLYEESAAVQQG